MATLIKHKPLRLSQHNRRHLVCGALLLLLSTPAAAGPPTTTTHCQPLDDNLKYSCSVMLMYQGEALTGAEVAQRADMPSMPLAHNVPPSKPEENPDKPGHYEFEVELEMHGQWRFIYEVLSPVRDQVQEKIMFAPGGDGGANSSGHSHSTHDGHTQHQ